MIMFILLNRGFISSAGRFKSPEIF